MDPTLRGLSGNSGDESASQSNDTRRRSQGKSFIRRYEQGPPSENISITETLSHFKSVAAQLSAEEMEQAATESFQNLSPEEREQFARLVNEKSGGRFTVRSASPDYLARVFTRLTSGDGLELGGPPGAQTRNIGGDLGGMLRCVSFGGVLGGGGGPALGGLLGEALGSNEGIRQDRNRPGQREDAGDISGLLQNPIVKAVLAGVVVTAMKRFGKR